MSIKSIHQFVSLLYEHDAVSNSVLLTQRFLQKLGYESHIYVQHINGKILKEQKRFEALMNSEQVPLLIHHAMGCELEDWIIQLKNPKILIYHNITPSSFFKPKDANYHHALLGRKQLTTFLPYMQGAIADSEYNAAELIELGYQNTVTIPLLFTLEDLLNQPFDDIVTPNRAKNGYLLLHVGRLARNKCIHEIINSYAELLYLLDGPSNLVLIGKMEEKKYLNELFRQCKKLGIKKFVRFLGVVTDTVKKAFLKQANAYLCLSEHEGFCVPLIEAAVSGVPIVAYDSSNIKNTLNNSGIIIKDKNPQKIAAYLSVLNKESDLRQRVIQDQYAALSKYQEARLLSQLSEFIRRVLTSFANHSTVLRIPSAN